jgi:hypothetical protein
LVCCKNPLPPKRSELKWDEESHMLQIWIPVTDVGPFSHVKFQWQHWFFLSDWRRWITLLSVTTM